MSNEITYLENQLNWLNERLDNGMNRQAANQIENELIRLQGDEQ